MKFSPVLMCLLLSSLVYAAPTSRTPIRRSTVPTVSASGDLTKADLLALVLQHLRHPDNDPFSGEFTRRYSGRHFVYAQSLMRDDGSEYGETNGRWTYDIDSRQLHVEAKSLDAIEFLYHSSNFGHYVGRTALGARARVAVKDDTSLALSPVNSADLHLSADLQADPAEAKEITSNTLLVIEGEISGENGVVTNCDTLKGGDATLDDPTDVRGLNCTVNVKVSKLTFYDGTKKSIIAEWPIRAIYSASSGPTTHATDAAPSFEVKPDLLPFYPERALRMELSGQTKITCKARTDRFLEDCRVDEEYPEGQNFGEAALLAAAHYRLALSYKTGAPITFTIRWISEKQ